MPISAFGVLAPNAKMRKFVVPEAPGEEDADPCGHSIAYERTTTGNTIRRRWIPWATMLLKVFAVEVLACPKCDSRMQRIAWTIRPKRRSRWRPRRGEGQRPESNATPRHQSHPRLL